MIFIRYHRTEQLRCDLPILQILLQRTRDRDRERERGREREGERDRGWREGVRRGNFSPVFRRESGCLLCYVELEAEGAILMTSRWTKDR